MDIHALLTSTISVTPADLKALRTFLVEHYSNKPHFSHPTNFSMVDLFMDHYIFTYANSQEFFLRRSKKLIFSYDVLEFKYINRRIEMHSSVVRDDRDRETVKDITDVIKQHCFGSIVD